MKLHETVISVKKDFLCPRDLLLREMKYFQDYLSSEADKWEDVDISVHCDIKIFEWLMSYINSKDGGDSEQPVLGQSPLYSVII